MADAEEPKDPKNTTPPENDDSQEAPLADAGTDNAVDDIVREEGDDELKAQDKAAGDAVVMKLGPGRDSRTFNRTGGVIHARSGGQLLQL